MAIEFKKEENKENKNNLLKKELFILKLTIIQNKLLLLELKNPQINFFIIPSQTKTYLLLS